ncbi:MAG: YncE family protein [Acidobacteriaceae bacterium]
MKRFFVLIVLVCFSLPVGLSIAGCGHNTNNYCLKNGHAYGPTINQVAYVILQPQTTGISLAWGQTQSLDQPTAYNCNNNTETVANYIYATTNPALADISPSGVICAGTWNRYSQGLVAPYTVCTPPSGANLTNCGTSTDPNAACGTAQVTATGGSVTSNPVTVYIHPPITSISISPGAVTQTGCFSQNTTVSDSNGNPITLRSETTVLGPDGTPIPTQDIGTITYRASDSSIVNIINTTNNGTGSNPNGTMTANQPGSTLITAQVASSSSAAGYFYTCPPTSIALSINGQTSATVTPSSKPTVVATLKDKNGTAITGAALDYSSTQPQNLSVASTGDISVNFPSEAEISAICQPGTCNPAPINQIGVYGTGTPIVSNTVQINAPGKDSDQIWFASTQSQYFSEVDLTQGTKGTPVRLPYVPNSMIANQDVSQLYFGSYRELMIYSTLTNNLSKQDTSVPGVVLAVSPDDSTLVINDQLRKVIYLYSLDTGSSTSIGGVATHAQFSPDSKTVYITGPDTLYVHNSNTGWSTYPLTSTQSTACTPSLDNTGANPYCGRDLTITVPQVAAFVTGSVTNAYGFCPDTTGSLPVYYPQAASVPADTEHIAATANGDHIIGATPTSLVDMWLYSDAAQSQLGMPTGGCPQPSPTTSGPLHLYPYTVSTPFSGFTPSQIDQVLTSPNSLEAFVTYQSSSPSGILPAYDPSATANQAGTMTNIQLSGSAGDPIAGAFSPDGSIFFASTTGDDLIHMIDPSTLKDTGTLNPGLVGSSQQPVPAEFIAVKSRSTT